MRAGNSEPGPGDVLGGRYEITAEIGRGGFGMVYLARQLNINRDVAIKILPAKFMAIADVVERFKREAQLASRLSHPNTITIHDYGQHENSLYIVMEYLRGEDLADILKIQEKLDPDRLLHIARQVLKSLHEAHTQGIIHRDLKPENIFLTRMGGEEDYVKVLDFGIAKLAMPDGSSLDQRKLTITGSTVGTPVYMSPEQAAGEEVNAQTDLYALGVIMYEMACGVPPFNDPQPVKVMRSHLFEEIPPLPDPSLHGTLLERVILKALQKEKPLRYQSAREFLKALEGKGMEIAAVPPNIMGLRPHKEDDLLEEAEPPTLEIAFDDLDSESSIEPPHQETASFDRVSRAPNPTSGEIDLLAPSTDPARRVDAVDFAGLANLPMPELVSATETSQSSSDIQWGPVPSSRLPSPGSGLSSVSSILTIVEHPEDGPEDIILLTQPKGETPIELEHAVRPLQIDDDLSTPEPSETRLLPTPEEGIAPLPRDAPPATPSGTALDWSWGDDAQAQKVAREVESGAFPQLRPKRPVWHWVALFLVLALAGGAVAAWQMGWLSALL